MSSIKKARKARQRAGLETYSKPQKEDTPVAARSFVLAAVPRKQGDAVPRGFRHLGLSAPRSAARAAAFILSRGIKR